MREACILEALRHPGVPRVYETGVVLTGSTRQPWVAIELLDGPTLADAIGDRPLPAPDVVDLLRDIGEILHHAHVRGIVHCNVHPAAIRRTPGSDKATLCLTEWSSACTHDSTAPQLIGAPPYLAPELARRDAFDGRADIYALGVVACEALTCAASIVSASRLAPQAPPALTALIDRMLAHDPVARPAAAEVRAEAIRIATTAPLEGDDAFVELVDVELVDIADLAPRGKLRWTPADPYQRPSPPPFPTSSRRRRP
jgi:serine/threonine protein kinase